MFTTCTKILVSEGGRRSSFSGPLRPSLLPTRERTERRGRYGPWNGLSTDTLDGGQGRGRPTHLNHHRWLCSQGRALRNTATDGSGAGTHRGCVRACVRVPVCLFPPPPLPPSALRHAPRPRLPGQPEPKVPDGGWGGGCQGRGTQCCPPTPTGGVAPRSGTLTGAAATG